MKIRNCITCIILLGITVSAHAFQPSAGRDTLDFPFKELPEVFPGTKSLTWTGDLSVRMLDGAHKFIEDKIEKAVGNRSRLWKRDLSSKENYEASVEPNRRRFMKYLGIADKTDSIISYHVAFKKSMRPAAHMQKISFVNDQEFISETSKYRVYQVRWPVSDRIHGEGILLQPKTKPAAYIIALPDADQQPEQLAGLVPGLPVESQFPRHLAENGYEVLVPVLISRTLLFPGEDKQQTYREWLYRQAFQMGRHIIGFEIQKVLSAVDWFKQVDKHARIGVAGYCEGGLIAFYAAAIDRRIDVTMVSGYFNLRQKVWDEPIYRNVWGLLTEFGDAEIATLIAPRPLIIEHSFVPEISDQLELNQNNIIVEGLPFTGYKGKLQTPEFKDLESENRRIDALTKRTFQQRKIVTGRNNDPVSFGSKQAMQEFTHHLGGSRSLVISDESPAADRNFIDKGERQKRQVQEIEDDIQWMVRDSDNERNRFFLYKVMPEFAERKWSTKPYHHYFSPDRVIEKNKVYRKYFSEEIMGRFEDSLLPFNTHTRKIYNKERWTGYEVVLDVYQNLFATGILLIPKDIKAGEKRPVVVTQHGRNDVPHKMIEGNFTIYNDAAAKLADQGFIVYIPQNPYRGEDRYRFLARKANTLKKTLFSFIISQHDQTLRWLGSLPFVDKNRIAFYGLSYGGETAMRVPAVLEGYCLSICSGDFGDWTRKVADTHFEGSFMNTLEWEMPYFNMGSTFSYAEMAYLIFPRPFMVERGHHDLVQPDEWVSYEYGKVKYFYDQFNMGNRTDIEFFNGGHTMRGEGTFRFLHRHLEWP